MNGLGVAALVVVAVPLVAVMVWVIREQRSARRRRRFLARYKERSVDGIRERVERERAAERAAQAETVVLPAVVADELPTTVLAVVRPEWPHELPERAPQEIRMPTPYRRGPLPQPDFAVMWRVLEGLRRLE